MVAVLLGGTSISFASDCISDPKECTPKVLCEITTEGTDGNKLWSNSTSSTKHVSFAQELGMNCGVVELKDPCETDPNECKINQLCEKATIDDAGTKSWHSEAQAYVVVAKEYGLECGVVEELKVETNKCKDRGTKSVKCRPIPVVPSDEETQTFGGALVFSSWSDSLICKYVINKGKRIHILEAKRRGLTCKVSYVPTDFRQAFISRSQLRRKQLQYALKELRFYTYGVDGLWGKGTKRGFERFVDWANLEGRSESAVFRDLLSLVDVPASFAAPTTTIINSSSNSSSTK